MPLKSSTNPRRPSGTTVLAFFTWLQGCSAAPSAARIPATVAPVAPAQSAATKPVSATTTRPSVTAAEAPAAGSPAPEPQPPFRPPDFAPPYASTAAETDGQWTPLGNAALGELAAKEPRVLFRTTVHPHRSSRFISTEIVAIDLRTVKLHWVLGKKDRGAADYAKVHALGLVAKDQRETTLAVFNGGFLAQHGRWGMMSHGITMVPPREIGCTLGTFKDGSVRIAPWTELPNVGLVSYRQAAPCLVQGNTLHGDLLNGNSRVWAGQNAALKTRRRSAVGIDATGEVLFYAVGTETEAIDLARGILAAGASHAMQLDINWNWTRFLTAGRKNEQPRITSTLIEDMAYGKNEYFSTSSDRDFFYLTLAGSVDATRHFPDR